MQAGLGLARERLDMGKYEEAKDVVEEVLKARRRLQMGNNQTIIGCRLLLAEWHRGMAQYKQAESLYTKCLAVMQSQEAGTFFEKDELHLTILVGLADLYRNTAQYADTRKSHEEAERVVAEVAEKDNSYGFRLAVAECRTSQAAYLIAKGDYDEAERLHREALDLRRLVLGLDHFKVASSLSHLGHVALLKSDFRKAARLIGDSLAMREAIFPNNHPAIAASLYLKGRLLHTMGQHKEAGELLAKSQSLRTTTLGSKHPSVAQCMWATAEITSALGYPARAEELYDSSLLLRQQYFPELELDGGKVVWHPSVVESIAGAAHLAEAKGMYQKAVEVFSEAITQLHRLCTTLEISDGSHPLMAVMQAQLAALYVALNKPTEAKRLLKNAGDIVYTKLGDSHLTAAQLHLSMGLMCNLEGWYRDAHECYVKARKVVWVLFRKKGRKKKKEVQKLDLKGAGISSSGDSLISEILTTPVDTLEERRIDYREVDPDFRDSGNDATHPLTAQILHGMAYNMTVNGPGYAEMADTLSDRAFTIRKDLYGKSTMAPDYDGSNKGLNESNLHSACFALSLVLRAQICAINREFGTAQDSFEVALRIAHAALGEDGAIFAGVFASYGSFLLQRAEAAMNDSDRQGDLEALFEEADDTLSKALMLLRAQLGDGHWMVAETMQQISFLLLYRGQVEEALALMKDGALPLFEEALGHSNPRTLFVGGCVGVCLQAAARSIEAYQSQPGEEGSVGSGMNSVNMASSGRELVKSTLNFFRLYAQGAFVSTHPWVVAIGGYDVLLQKPARPPTAEGGADDNDSTVAASLVSSDAAVDREIEEIRDDLGLIPVKPEIGLLFNSNISNLKEMKGRGL
uniref:Uncharacterized protein n=1 Tax=uncultured organism MedDCM-OCT-S08-C998 TaxID=743643 RepID=D6PJC3_9ZZZZ|nr:hypothetical protein [uncultured organism MedDCM-OCT-S08-C998]